MSGSSLLVSVRGFVGDGIINNEELDVWVARAGT